MDGNVSVLAFQSLEDWAQQHFGQAQLGDRRRTRRAVKVAVAMAAHPAGSIPGQSGDWAATKGAYRLFDGDKVTFEALCESHWRQTRRQAAGRRRVLMVQDGTQLDFSRHQQTEGLGPIGDGGGQGLMLHSVMAVDPCAGSGEAPEVLGLAHQHLWRRRCVPKGETRTQRKARQNQARVWSDAVRAVGSSNSESRWIHVGDREADNFDFFDACRQADAGFVVRAYQNRRAALGHKATDASGYLMDLARSLEPIGGRKLYVRRRRNRSPRWVQLQVASSAVTIFAPWLSGGTPSPIRCWVVRVWEESPLPGQSPIEWVLISSEPADDAEAALEIAEWYACRWLIEEYHKCLKTGCRVESRQLHTVDRLEGVIGMLAVVAVRLLQLKQYVRCDPDSPAETYVSPEHVKMLAAYYAKPQSGMTVYEFWRLVAQLGGFLGRKGDGEPGWQTLWQGWRKLDLMTLGAKLAEERRCG
jgi:hypothetical protein